MLIVNFPGALESIAVDYSADQAVVRHYKKLPFFRFNDHSLAGSSDARIHHREKNGPCRIVRSYVVQETRSFLDLKRSDLMREVRDARVGGYAEHDRAADGGGVVCGTKIGHEYDRRFSSRRCRRVFRRRCVAAAKRKQEKYERHRD